MFNLTETAASGTAIPVFSPGDGITSANFTAMMQPVANRLKFLESSALGNSQRMHLSMVALPSNASHWTYSTTYGAWVQQGNALQTLDFFAPALKAGWQIVESRAYVHGNVDGGGDVLLPDLGLATIQTTLVDMTTGAGTSSSVGTDPSTAVPYNTRHEFAVASTLTVTANHRARVRITGVDYTSGNPSSFGVYGVSLLINTNP